MKGKLLDEGKVKEAAFVKQNAVYCKSLSENKVLYDSATLILPVSARLTNPIDPSILYSPACLYSQICHELKLASFHLRCRNEIIKTSVRFIYHCVM